MIRKTIVLAAVLVISAYLYLLCWVPSGQAAQKKYVIVIHCGAGYFPEDASDEKKAGYTDAMQRALDKGEAVLQQGGSALDAVEQIIRILEDDEHFNAGRGATLTQDGIAELDASIMDGKDLRAGAVGSVTIVKNPISLARLVMEKTKHVLLVGPGAERFAKEQNVEIVDPEYFITPAEREQYEKWKKEKFGTVGAVVLDSDGNLAAGTSTGGTDHKLPGRLGDSPIIGAGTYADNRTCAVSCTGVGEVFIKNAVAFRMSALMMYCSMSLQEAADEIMENVLEKGQGGFIAVDREGNVVMPFTTGTMFRGVTGSEIKREVLIYK